MATRKQIIAAIEAVQESGETNMFDMSAVAYWAMHLRHHAAALWLADKENRAAYADFILAGNESNFPE